MDGTGMARYVVDAVVLEGRSPREVARAHGISKSWIYELIKRYRVGGYDALRPRCRRPRSRSIRAAITSRSRVPRLSRTSRDMRPGCPETQQWCGGWDSNPHTHSGRAF